MKLSKILILVAIAIAAYLIFKRAGSSGFGLFGKSTVDTVYKSDTIWKHHDTVITKEVKIKQVIHDSIPVAYDAHPDYDSLKSQYTSLVKEHLARNIYEDTLRIDSFGHVLVLDTVSQNKLVKRSYIADYKIPVIKDSIFITKTEEAPKRNQVYLGGAISSSKTFRASPQVGILYKSKSDKITGVYVALLPGGQIGYGIQSYWKLNLKK